MLPFLLALNDYTGNETCQEVLPVHHCQGEATDGSNGECCVYPPLELMHIDYLCLEPGKGKEENFLLVADHFTPYAQAFVTWCQMAHTMDKALWDNFIIHYGLPEKIISDQGRNFESSLIANLCKLMGTKKLRTSWYHPWQMASARGVTPPKSTCWGCCLQSTSLTGKAVLECGPCI